jgi:hypothetical protein
VGAEPPSGEGSGVVGARLADEPCLRTEHGRPRRDVRRLPARPELDLGVRVPVRSERSGEADDDVEGEVSDANEHGGRDRKITSVDGEESRRRLRSFLLGGLVGASAALAALDRRRRLARRRGRPRGLAAFESAPCYLELLEQEREQRRSAS